MLWVQFFEAHAEETNRIARSALNMARNLIERKDELDAGWKEHAGMLIDFVNKNFQSSGMVCWCAVSRITTKIRGEDIVNLWGRTGNVQQGNRAG